VKSPGSIRTLRVEGMDCAGCAVSVRTALERVSGVKRAEVDFAAGLASITGDAASDAMLRAVEQAGYRAIEIESFEDPELLRASVEARQAQAERAWKRRARTGVCIWVPMEALHWIGEGSHAHEGWMPVTLMVGGTLSMVLVGAGFWSSAWSVLRKGRSNMDVLIALGATVAYVASVITWLAQRAGALEGHPLWFSESAALLAIISIGHWLEAKTTRRAGAAVRELLQLQPDEVERIGADGESVRVPMRDVRPGDLVRVRPGGRVPVDGCIESGAADLDESVISGESLPVTRRAGDPVAAGTLNLTGMIAVRVAVGGRVTSLMRVALMVQRAQASRAPIQALADRVAGVFVPAVLAIAAVTLLGWGIVGAWSTGVLAATTVLIISCPCALGLATPMAIMAGAGEASLRGVLVKEAAALERAGRVQRVLFDKTGTLTQGAPRIERVECSGDETRALALAAAAEAGSEHPIGRAIVAAALTRGVAVQAASDFEAVPGVGVRAMVQGVRVEVVRDARASCVVRADGVELARLHLRDSVRAESAEVIARLTAMGLQVGMLTGDARIEAERVGGLVGVHEVHAELLPADKARILREAGATAAMVGDGVNDAGALAESALGIAMGSGVAIAGESAAVVLVGGRLTALPGLFHVGRETLRCIRQNLALAFLYNAIAIPAAAFALLGPHGPMVAAVAMAVSDLSVLGNAARLRWQLARQRVRAARSPSPGA
jgi:Cu+-exporting ATPase